MLNTLILKDSTIQIDTCIYKEDAYSFIEISKGLIGQFILSDAICNGVLNLNALYKNFIDENFEFNLKVQDHQMTETLLDDGYSLITMDSLDKYKRVVNSHRIKIKFKSN